MKYNKSTNTWIIEIHDAQVCVLRECLSYCLHSLSAKYAFCGVDEIINQIIVNIQKLLELLER